MWRCRSQSQLNKPLTQALETEPLRAMWDSAQVYPTTRRSLSLRFCFSSDNPHTTQIQRMRDNSIPGVHHQEALLNSFWNFSFRPAPSLPQRFHHSQNEPRHAHLFRASAGTDMGSLGFGFSAYCTVDASKHGKPTSYRYSGTILFAFVATLQVSTLRWRRNGIRTAAPRY
jgi:hypothetical protein